MDRGAWQDTVCKIAKSQTHLSDQAQAQTCQETKISYAMQCNKKFTRSEILKKLKK